MTESELELLKHLFAMDKWENIQTQITYVDMLHLLTKGLVRIDGNVLYYKERGKTFRPDAAFFARFNDFLYDYLTDSLYTMHESVLAAHTDKVGLLLTLPRAGTVYYALNGGITFNPSTKVIKLKDGTRVSINDKRWEQLEDILDGMENAGIAGNGFYKYNNVGYFDHLILNMCTSIERGEIMNEKWLDQIEKFKETGSGDYRKYKELFELLDREQGTYAQEAAPAPYGHEEAKAEPAVDVPDEQVIWVNPRAKKKNQKEVKVGYRVLVNRKPLLLEVVSSNPETKRCTLLIDGKRSAGHSWENVYPVFLQDKTNVLKVGDVITARDREEPMIIKKIAGTVGIETTNGLRLKHEDVTSVYAKDQQSIEVERFSCGTLRYDGITYNNVEELQKDYPTYQVNHTPVEIDYRLNSIAEHFKISHDAIKPKENQINDVLYTTLEHPLNIEKKRWALLVGESGSGKTEAAVAYCARINRPYIKLQGNAQVTADDLVGYKSITTGEYIPSLLRDAVENGKVFIFDEIDACNPNILLTLNGLKQEYFQFPDALVKVHPDFRMLATANTLEYSEEYNGRVPMDKATQARFKIIEYNMEGHELALRYGLDYIKDIPHINRLTPREVEGIVLDKRIAEEMRGDNKERAYA